jgi:undecaprenyl-diphosphatase
MALADAERPEGRRECEQARLRDGLALGLAQAAALVPGVSRSGATLTAARARGFSRRGAQSLSWAVALPVMAGASALQGVRVVRVGAPAPVRRAMLAGLASAFCSTTASAALLRGPLSEIPLLPWALYRCALAVAVLARAGRAG